MQCVCCGVSVLYIVPPSQVRRVGGIDAMFFSRHNIVYFSVEIRKIAWMHYNLLSHAQRVVVTHYQQTHAQRVFCLRLPSKAISLCVHPIKET